MSASWQTMFNRLDALSRQRALTESESGLLELAIYKIDRASERRANGEARRVRA